VTSPGVFAVFDLYQVYLPLISFVIVSSAQFPMKSSVLHLLQVRSGRWFGKKERKKDYANKVTPV